MASHGFCGSLVDFLAEPFSGYSPAVTPLSGVSSVASSLRLEMDSASKLVFLLKHLKWLIAVKQRDQGSHLVV